MTPTKLNWGDADIYCTRIKGGSLRNKYGHLASIFSKDEEDKIGELRNLSHPDDAVWIGLRNSRGATRADYWNAEIRFMPYSHWAPGMPGDNYFMYKNCGAMGAGNLWNEFRKDTEMYGVC